jgi:hypothetical protein
VLPAAAQQSRDENGFQVTVGTFERFSSSDGGTLYIKSAPNPPARPSFYAFSQAGKFPVIVEGKEVSMKELTPGRRVRLVYDDKNPSQPRKESRIKMVEILVHEERVERHAKRVADLMAKYPGRWPALEMVYEHENRAVNVPMTTLTAAQPGNLYRFTPKTTIRVTQVLKPDEMLASWGNSSFHFKGIPTAGLVDDRLVELPDAIFETSTYKYTTVTGALRTVTSFKPGKVMGEPTKDDVIAARKERDEIDKVLAAEDVQQAAAVKAAAEQREKAKEADKVQKTEASAAARLAFAKQLITDGKTDLAKLRLEQIVKEYPGTKAVAEAKDLLKKLR